MYKKYDARIKAGLMIHTSGGAEVQESRAFDPRKVKSEGTPPHTHPLLGVLGSGRWMRLLPYHPLSDAVKLSGLLP